MAATPVIAVHSSPAIDILVEVQVYYDGKLRGSRRVELSSTNGADQNSQKVTEAKQSILSDLAWLDGWTPHICRLEFDTKEGRVSHLCCNKRFFDNALNDCSGRNGRHLCFIADFRNFAQSTSRQRSQTHAARVISSSCKPNCAEKFYLFDSKLNDVLFGNQQLFSQIAEGDPALEAKLRDAQFLDGVRANSKKLLALLTLENGEQPLGQLFLDFLDQGYRDDDIPFELDERPTFCDSLTWDHIMSSQHRFTVAELSSLKRDKRLHDFAETQPLPFQSMSIIKHGGYGTIYNSTLLPEHPEIYTLVWIDNGEKHRLINPSLAVKKLNERSSRTPAEFRQETSVLVTLHSLNHPHIVRLITAFRHGNDYYLVFPLAKYDLQKLFEQEEPPKSSEYIQWILEQMAGIADALKTIHEDMRWTSKDRLQPTRHYQRSNGGTQNQLGVPQTRQHNDLSLRDDKSAKSGETLKGMHSDLAPNNLLLFDRLDVILQGAEARHGRIVMSDFGLAKLRREIDGSRSGNIKGQANYFAPESEPDQSGDRYQNQCKDVWCFGAIMLQLLVWLEGGPGSFQFFEESRSGPTNSACLEMTDQGFFMFHPTTGQKVLRPAVEKQMERLRRSSSWLATTDLSETQRVQKAVPDVLKLIDDCLTICPTKRPTATDVSNRLRTICKQLATEAT